MFLNILKTPEFLLAVLALAQTLALTYFGVPDDIWKAVNAILLVLIGTISAQKLGARVSLAVKEFGLSFQKTMAGALRKLGK